MKSRDVRKKPKQSLRDIMERRPILLFCCCCCCCCCCWLFFRCCCFFCPKTPCSPFTAVSRSVVKCRHGRRAREIEVRFILQSWRGGIEALGLTILAILNIRFSVFVPKKLWSFGFRIHFGLRILRDLAFGFRFSSKIQTGSRNFFDLSSIWAAMKPLRWSQKIAKRRCYWEECVTNQMYWNNL